MSVDPAVVEHVETHGFAVLRGVIAPAAVAAALDALAVAAERSEARGIPTRMDFLDPGGCNIRVYDLIEHDPVFASLAEHPVVIDHVRALLGDDLMLSNFSANTALPGSGSMNAHCDQSTVMPEPWPVRYTLNAIWCLHDVDEGNGATRYLPGSHRFTCFADVPSDPKAGMRPFEASAGDVLLMDGRLWHTSGENRSADRERAMLFAFYARGFLRLQNNWWQTLSRETRAGLSPQLKHWLGLTGGNMEHGAYLAG